MAYTQGDFANYRNLARRAENSGHPADELRYLNKCVEIYEFRHGIDCTKDTFLDIVARINALNAQRLGK